MSSGEGSKLMNLFFLPNESGNIRTLNYLKGCVPTLLLLQSLHMLSPTFPRFQVPHPPTNPYSLWLSTEKSLSGRENFSDSHMTNALLPLCISVNTGLSFHQINTCSLYAWPCSECFIYINSFIVSTNLWDIIAIPTLQMRKLISKEVK